MRHRCKQSGAGLIITKEEKKGRKYQTRPKENREHEQPKLEEHGNNSGRSTCMQRSTAVISRRLLSGKDTFTDRLWPLAFSSNPSYPPSCLSSLTLSSLDLEHSCTLSFFAKATHYKQAQKVRGKNPPQENGKARRELIEKLLCTSSSAALLLGSTQHSPCQRFLAEFGIRHHFDASASCAANANLLIVKTVIFKFKCIGCSLGT